MEEQENVGNNQNFSIDPEQLKIVVNIIKKCAMDLTNAKQKADNAWNECRASLGENVTKHIDERKEVTNKKFKKAIAEVENSSNVLSTVANIWKDSESEILYSAKEFEELFTKINSNLMQAFGFTTFMFNNNDNNNNNTSDTK